MGGRSRTGALLATAALTIAAAPAAADSLVYVRGGDVQLTGEERTVTLTTDGGYESPSMADDGTIVAVRRVEQGGATVRYVHRMDQTGRLLNPPTVAVPVDNRNYTGPLGAQVSPDGRLVAFHYFNRGATSRPEMPRVAIAPTDRDLGDLGDIFSAGYYLNPTWIGSSTIVLFGTPGFIPNVQTYTLGGGGISDWFDAPGVGHIGGGELSADGTRFAATADGGAVLQLFSVPGPPPAAPQPTCRFSGAAGTFSRPRWSPDGRGLVWEQPDGLHVAEVPAVADCPAIVERLVAPGGSDPDWGPADLPSSGTPGDPAASIPDARRGPRRSGAPVVQRYPLAVAVKVACARPCRLSARLVQAGRTISQASRRLRKDGTARVVLPKRGRRGRATVVITLDGRTQRKRVTL